MVRNSFLCLDALKTLIILFLVFSCHPPVQVPLRNYSWSTSSSCSFFFFCKSKIFKAFKSIQLSQRLHKMWDVVLMFFFISDKESKPLFVFASSRTVTIPISAIVATSTGVCCPPTPARPRRWCWPRSLSSRRRRTSSSPRCWTSSSVTSPVWPPSTTNLPMPLWRVGESWGSRCPATSRECKTILCIVLTQRNE